MEALAVSGLQLRSLPALQRALLLEGPLEASQADVRGLGLLSHGSHASNSDALERVRVWAQIFLPVTPTRMELLSAQKLGMKCRPWKGFWQIPL